MLMLEREIVSFFELSENFRFAEDHRVEAAGNLEKVFDAFGFGESVEFVRDRIATIVKAHEEILKLRERLPDIERSRGVNLDAIARRENDRFFRNAGFAD